MTLPLRVIIGGHTGLNKRAVLDNVCAFINSQQPDLSAKHYAVEDHLRVTTFIDANPEKQAITYLEALETVLTQIRSERPDVAFLSMHFSFYSAGVFVLPFSLDLRNHINSRYFTDLIKQEFDPDYIVTLIDDIAATKARIIAQGYAIQAQELLAWRDIELAIADALCPVLIQKSKRNSDLRSRRFERSILVSIRHPASLLYKYLFKPMTPRIYLSFRISGTRQNETAVAEINRLRSLMAEKYTVFDPLCIDDLPLLSMADTISRRSTPRKGRKKRIGAGKIIGHKFPADRRWFIPANNTMIGEDTHTDVRFSREELSYLLWTSVSGAKTRIENQVERRDYRLIDQSDFVVYYRPQYGKVHVLDRDFSGGTRGEWFYAKDTLKPRFFVHDNDLDGDVIAEAFKPALDNMAETNKIIKSPLSKNRIQDEALGELFKAIDKTRLM